MGKEGEQASGNGLVSVMQHNKKIGLFLRGHQIGPIWMSQVPITLPIILFVLIN